MHWSLPINARVAHGRARRQQPAAALIVEGYGVHEPRFAGITVYATQVTTKALQAAKRKEQAAPVNEGEGGD